MKNVCVHFVYYTSSYTTVYLRLGFAQVQYNLNYSIWFTTNKSNHVVIHKHPLYSHNYIPGALGYPPEKCIKLK